MNLFHPENNMRSNVKLTTDCESHPDTTLLVVKYLSREGLILSHNIIPFKTLLKILIKLKS